MSQVHFAEADANGLGFVIDDRLVGAAGFELGLGVIQHAHFSLTSAFETRHVSHVHLDEVLPWLLLILLKRLVGSGAFVAGTVVAIVAGVLVGLGPGFADEQHAHLSAVSSLDTRHVPQVHFGV